MYDELARMREEVRSMKLSGSCAGEAILAKTKFGQFIGPIRFANLVCVSWSPKGGAQTGPNPEKEAPKGGGSGGWGSGRVGGPKGWGWEVQNFALFLSVEFWWCLKRQDPQMCAFGVLGLLCETPAAT